MSNALRAMIAKAASRGFLHSLKYGAGVQVSYQYRNTTAVTLWALPLDEQAAGEIINLIETEAGNKIFQIPTHQSGMRADISNKVLTSDVATITTRAAHGFTANRLVRVKLNTADTVFDGRQEITGVTSTTFTYDKTNANVASVAAKGVVEGVVQPGDTLTYEGDIYEIVQVRTDSLRTTYYLECRLRKEMRIN